VNTLGIFAGTMFNAPRGAPRSHLPPTINLSLYSVSKSRLSQAEYKVLLLGPNLSAELTWIDQVSFALIRGYLTRQHTFFFIFGSLGVIGARFKTLVTCFVVLGYRRSKFTWKYGFDSFQRQGENPSESLIMVEAGKLAKGRT
jgi:hypothetical protein